MFVCTDVCADGLTVWDAVISLRPLDFHLPALDACGQSCRRRREESKSKRTKRVRDEIAHTPTVVAYTRRSPSIEILEDPAGAKANEMIYWVVMECL